MTTSADWSIAEVEAVVVDYFDMLALELAGAPYSKTEHRRALLPKLLERTAQSVEYKHANISAALIDAGFPYIDGYKPRSNYQSLLARVVGERLADDERLRRIAAADVEAPIGVPEVQDILEILKERSPSRPATDRVVRDESPIMVRGPTNYLEREARNRSLGEAGELFAIRYEQARLIAAGKEHLADRIEHTSKLRGDHEGFDVLSYEVDGRERLLEVKTTKYGSETPFFVTDNEVKTSARHAEQYHVYRLYSFRRSPAMYALSGALERSCFLSAKTFLARPM